MINYDMSSGPGRTYKYYPSESAQSKPLFEFGFGLSLTTFKLSCTVGNTTVSGSSGDIHASCAVRNTGTRDGDAVVLVYHSAGKSIRAHAHHPVPRKALVWFFRVHVSAGQTTQPIPLVLPVDHALFLIDGKGDRVVYAGDHTLLFDIGDGSVPVEATVKVA